MASAELDGSALTSSVAFTGRLACMSRAEAFDVVRQRGGTPSPAVTKRTQVLIVPPPRTVIGIPSRGPKQSGFLSVLQSLCRTQNDAVRYNALPHEPPQVDQ